MFQKVFQYVQPSAEVSAEEAKQISLENESALTNLGINIEHEGIHLTAPLSFHRAYQLAYAGNPKWIDEFEAVGCDMIERLRAALGDECHRGRVRAIEREKRERLLAEDHERAERLNAEVEAAKVRAGLY